MNIQPQTVWIPTEDQTDSVRFTKGYSGDFTLGREYLEKREGVILLTPERFKQIVGDAITDVILKSNNLPFDNYINWKKEYLNQLIQP